MKESIDVYEGNPVYQYKLYDALTEYALYGTWPEDDGSLEAKGIIAFVQSMVPSIMKSSSFNKKCAESGAVGGRSEKVSDEQLETGIKDAALKKKGIPTRQEIVNAVKERFGINITVKTVSRRCSDNKKKELVEETLRQNGDKINVSEGQVMSQGQNEDIINVPDMSGDKMETQGQNGDKNNVPDNKSICFDF